MKLLIIFFLAILTMSLNAQQKDSAAKNVRTIDSVLANEQLNVLDGKPKVFYSDGFSVRAKALQELFHKCIDFYEPQFPGEKFTVPVYILDKTDWQKPPLGFPYGMPFYTPDNKIVVIAAEKNALRRLTGLPDDPERSDSILSTFDYQPIHELGHYFFFTMNNVNKEKWFNEFLATYFLVCFLKEKNLEPDLLEKMKADYPVSHKTLQDFQKLYVDVGPANYHWYQYKFAKLGFTLYPQFKVELIKLVLQNYAAGGKDLDGITLLKNLAPDKMKEWLKEMQ
jgi:hypothetical protein